MWPFRRKKKTHPQTIQFSQLDITESFGDNKELQADDWIVTTPINSMLDDPKSVGLAAADANDEEVYGVASKLSELREELVSNPGDGVYCPVCHIANIEISKLRTPCPQCGRPLLSFGWD